MATRYVASTALGSGDGSSPANAALYHSAIDTQVGLAGPGGEVVFLTGTYTPTVSMTPMFITNGGAPGNPVTIRGEASSGTILRGTRSEPWTPAGTTGDPCFRLFGSGHLRFRWLHFERFGNGCVFNHSTEPIAGLTVEDCTATNVQRFLECVGTVTGLRVSNCTVVRYTKGIGRFQGDTNDGLIENVVGDSEGIDHDPIAFGWSCSGTVHDIEWVDCSADNNVNTDNPYYNGDGWSFEEETYDLRLTDCSSSGNADGGVDLKGGTAAKPHVLTRFTASGNKRNYRFWGYANLYDCVGLDPVSMGGTGSVCQIFLAPSADVVTAYDFTCSGGGPEVLVFEAEAGTGVLNLWNADISHHASAVLETEGAGTSINFLTGNPPLTPLGFTVAVTFGPTFLFYAPPPGPPSPEPAGIPVTVTFGSPFLFGGTPAPLPVPFAAGDPVLASMLTEVVSIQADTIGATDAYGEAAVGWAPPVFAAARVEPSGGVERGDNYPLTLRRWRVYLPAGTAVTLRDRITWQGIEMRVEQLGYSHGDAGIHHLELDCLEPA